MMKFYRNLSVILTILLLGLSFYFVQSKTQATNSESKNLSQESTIEIRPIPVSNNNKMQFATNGLILKDFGISIQYPQECPPKERIGMPYNTEMVEYEFYCKSSDLFLKNITITTADFLENAVKNLAKIQEDETTPYTGEIQTQKQLFSQKTGNAKYEFKKINQINFLIFNDWNVPSGEIDRVYLTFVGNRRIITNISWNAIWESAAVEKNENLLHRYDQQADTLLSRIGYFIHNQP